MSVLVGLAHDIAASWGSEFTSPPAGAARLAAFSSVPLPSFVRMRRAEGYAFYAVYPEAYLLAATAARAAAPGNRQVIGIRDIGTGLAAIVAAATGAPLPVTVRTTGDPYLPRIAVAPQLAAEWTRDPDATIAIVDQGPGLTGSAFGAVGDALERQGVTRIECFASHAGELGAMACARHRERWARTPRYVVDVDTLLVHTRCPAQALSSWIAELVGPLLAPLEDLSAGAWRAYRFAADRSWPASVTYQERRKWLARTSSGTWIAKFVGLGRSGDRALARARSLYLGRFTPEVAGLRHGFLVERWLGEATPLDLRRCDRPRLVDHVGRYLGFRARALPASDRGASLARLVEMARGNATHAIGGGMAARLDRWGPHLSTLERSIRPVEIDGRLHAWEWLVHPDGTITKTDALDHHAGHDLVGCQDIAWDLAGAAIELGLTPAEEKRLLLVVSDIASRSIDEDLLRLMRTCYLAFQFGRHAIAIDTADAAEGARLQIIVDRYARLLRESL